MAKVDEVGIVATEKAVRAQHKIKFLEGAGNETFTTVFEKNAGVIAVGLTIEDFFREDKIDALLGFDFSAPIMDKAKLAVWFAFLGEANCTGTQIVGTLLTIHHHRYHRNSKNQPASSG